jgi:hypothetical protein
MFLLFGFGPNTLLAFLASVVLVFGSMLLWRPGEPPILLFVFLYQWLQGGLGPFYGNFFGLNVQDLSLYGGRQEQATLLSLVGILVLAAGMRMGAGRHKADVAQKAKAVIDWSSYSIWLYLLIGSTILAAAAQAMAIVLPGLSQLLLALADFKWSAYFLFTYVTFARSRNYTIWVVVFVAELAVSISAYFSGFKWVFLYTLIAIAASRVRFSARRKVAGAMLGACLILAVLVWSAIKVQYRAFLSGGAAAQVVVVDYRDQAEKFYQLVSALDASQLRAAVDGMVNRFMYVEYFGVVLSYVPGVVERENGALWFDAVTRPFFPRLFFPQKPIIDDSELTNTYTGLHVAGRNEGSSISLGYIAESYIDFGELGMMPVIFMVGLTLGGIYRWLCYGSKVRGLLGMALATNVIMQAAYLETAAAKLVGGVFASVIAAWLATLVLPHLLKGIVATWGSR